MSAAKNLLVFADGHVEEIADELLGHTFVRAEQRNGERWERRFRCHLAIGVDPSRPERHPKLYSMVGVESEYVRIWTREEWAAKDDEFRARMRRSQLRAVLGDK